MKKIKTYKIVSDSSSLAVSLTVNEMLDEGWEVHGNITVSLAGSDEYGFDRIYAQVMVHEKELSVK